MNKLGFTTGAEFTFLGCRLEMLGRLDSERFTTTATISLDDHAPRLATFDFDVPGVMGPLLHCLAQPLRLQVRDALFRAPFRLSLDLMVEVDWTTRLGVPTRGQHDTFIPFIVEEVHHSRLNREPLVGSDDVPAHEFRLRKAFDALRGG